MELLSVDSILENWSVQSVLIVLTVAQSRRGKWNTPPENARQKQHQFADENNFLSHDQQKANQQGQDQGQVEFESQKEGQEK